MRLFAKRTLREDFFVFVGSKLRWLITEHYD